MTKYEFFVAYIGDLKNYLWR